MAKSRVYVSFDVSNDYDLLELLAAQAGEPESTFEITDWSGRGNDGAAVSDADLRDRIRNSDHVLIICGELTHAAENVSQELTIAREENTPFLLLWGRKGRLVSAPASAGPTDRIHEWSWAVLEEQLKAV